MTDLVEQGRQIRAARKAKKMTQAELAKAVGVGSVRTIQSLESGERATHPATVMDVKKLLGMMGNHEDTREGWPSDIQTITDMVGAYLSTMTPEARRDWIHDMTLRIVRGE